MAKSYNKHVARAQQYTRNQRLRDAENRRLKRAANRLAAHIEQAQEDEENEQFSSIHFKSGR
ncbi:hypothetical protein DIENCEPHELON_38 [Klebsiella phage vB_KaeS_Diencephalon]|nr:hypothetical protein DIENCEPHELON_38 [Klebsiella phage vB_KaeS_Diencephalon]